MSSECELGRTQNNSGSCFRASSLRKLVVCMEFASVSSRARILKVEVSVSSRFSAFDSRCFSACDECFLDSRRFSVCDGCLLDSRSLFSLWAALLGAAVRGYGHR